MSDHLRVIIAYAVSGMAALCVVCMFAAPFFARSIPRDEEDETQFPQK